MKTNTKILAIVIIIALIASISRKTYICTNTGSRKSSYRFLRISIFNKFNESSFEIWRKNNGYFFGNNWSILSSYGCLNSWHTHHPMERKYNTIQYLIDNKKTEQLIECSYLFNGAWETEQFSYFHLNNDINKPTIEKDFSKCYVCNKHIDKGISFVCTHVVDSIKNKKSVGFFCSSEDYQTYPDALCEECSKMQLLRKSNWSPERYRLCISCYEKAKSINESNK